MALTKRERIILLREKNWTLPNIAWAVDEEPDEVLRVLNEERMPLTQGALREQRRIGRAMAVRLRASGEPLHVVYANFCDLISWEELARV